MVIRRMVASSSSSTPPPGLHAPQLPQDGGELVTQGLVDPGIALHHNVPVEQPPGDVVLLGQPGQADGNLKLFVLLRDTRNATVLFRQRL